MSVCSSGFLSGGSAAPGDLCGCISSGGGGGYHRKQERHLHTIITTACKDALLDYIQFKTCNEEEIRSYYCSSINSNCKSFSKLD